MDETKLSTPREIDAVFRWPAGRAQRLAKRGRLPCLILPNGEIRFSRPEIERLVRHIPAPTPPPAALGPTVTASGCTFTTSEGAEK